MSVRLEDYQEQLAGLPPAAADVLRREWPEVTRVFSPLGLDRYVRGALALAQLGRGAELVETYLEEAPAVAQELGEDAAEALLGAAMKMASRTSGAVLAQLFASAPTATKRLADPELFGAFLQLVDHLLGQVPRGVRPMLENLEMLLSQLTLGGLRRWANWGAHAYRTDVAEQARYFGLASKEAQAMLQQERRGTLFVDVQRRIRMYLRALWGRDFFLRPTSGDFDSREGYRPYIAEHFIHLPDAYDADAGVPGLERYRAAAAHCAAHVAYTRVRLVAEDLTPLEQAAIGVIEDARVEALAIAAFPGLEQLWARHHRIVAEGAPALAGVALDRVARALLDHGFEDADATVTQVRACFAEARRVGRLADNAIAREIGLALARDLARRGLAFNPRRDAPSADYRDDNRYVWEYEGPDLLRTPLEAPDAPKQVRKRVNLMEFVNAVDVETAGDDADEIWVLGTELFDDDGTTWNEREGREPIAEPVHYAEWDYQIQLERPVWATVIERRPQLGELDAIERILAEHKQVSGRLKRLLEALQPQGVQRIRKLEDGDEIDLDAAIGALTDIRLGMQPEPRVMMRAVRNTRDLSVLALLDLSESANDEVAGQDYTVLGLTRAATVLLGEAIDRVGDAFALHGFCSDGRHDIAYYRFKNFEEPYGALAKARLAGMTAQRSTRMGAAIRHATAELRRRRSAKRLLLLVTDGEPADIDVRDPQYLRLDAKKAVEDAARAGIVTFCINLDPRADQYVARIFGAGRYMIVDHVERLPEKLPLAYAGLTRR